MLHSKRGRNYKTKTLPRFHVIKKAGGILHAASGNIGTLYSAYLMFFFIVYQISPRCTRKVRSRLLLVTVDTVLTVNSSTEIRGYSAYFPTDRIGAAPSNSMPAAPKSWSQLRRGKPCTGQPCTADSTLQTRSSLGAVQISNNASDVQKCGVARRFPGSYSSRYLCPAEIDSFDGLENPPFSLVGFFHRSSHRPKSYSTRLPCTL